MKLKTAVFLSFIVTSAIFSNSVWASNAKTCVVSFWDSDEINLSIQQAALDLLEKMGYSKESPRFDFFFGQARSIKDCLEGNYEDVIILAHKSILTDGHPFIVYNKREEVKCPATGNTIGVQYTPQVLDARIFKNAKISPTLRQITLITCDTEEIVEKYLILKTITDEHHINLKFQPASLSVPVAEVTAAVVTAGVLPAVAKAFGQSYDLHTGLRTQELWAAMIAESAQDENAETIYCLLRTNLVIAYEHGESSCLRNRFKVDFHGFALGLKTTTRFAKIRMGEDLPNGAISVLDIELGLFRGIEAGISSQPLEFNKDTFGASVSLLDYLSVMRN